MIGLRVHMLWLKSRLPQFVRRPTKRTLNNQDSEVSTAGIFLASGFSCPQAESMRATAPVHANGWAFPCKISSQIKD